MKELICPICEIEEIDPARAKLGYISCLTCGELHAKNETEKLRGRVAIAYDKGCYQYITEETNLEDLG